MDQFIVNIEPGADKALLRKIIKNIKGISDVVLRKESPTKPLVKSSKLTDKKKEEWIKKMMDLSNGFDSSMIDLNDEKTKYILSK